jgi:hypothetical protein
MVSAGSLGIFIHFFPFSPRWLAMRGRDEDCLKSLVLLRNLPAADRRVVREWKGILAEVKFQNEVIARDYPDSSGIGLELRSWADLFSKKYIRRTMVAIGLPFFQQVMSLLEKNNYLTNYESFLVLMLSNITRLSSFVPSVRIMKCP